MTRENYSSGAEWEPIVGYSRAIKVGNTVFVSGTTATNRDGNIVGGKDLALQTRQAIENIKQALEHFGLGLEAVYRTRMYVTDIDQWELAGKVHGYYFSVIRPVTTMVEVSRLIAPEMLIEIEAEAMSI